MSMSHQAMKGSSYDRRARKQWLLSPAAGFGGNGTTVPCAAHPDESLTYETLTADRKVPGSQGGTYRRTNLRPMCLSANSSRQDRTDWIPAVA
jgi:hypothetical protein